MTDVFPGRKGYDGNVFGKKKNAEIENAEDQDLLKGNDSVKEEESDASRILIR